MVAIKDFEMPRYCVTCDICRSDDGENLYCGITHSDVIDLYHRQTDCPLVEAISKADYENRLKADLKAIFVELQMEIEEMDSGCGWEGYRPTAQVLEVIQQKINALRGEKDE